jgi:hypothetical protein
LAHKHQLQAFSKGRSDMEYNGSGKCKFLFGDIVVVDEIQIGVICKCWEGFLATQPPFKQRGEPNYGIYVASYNGIKNYPESEVERYKVRHKYLDDEELEYQRG